MCTQPKLLALEPVGAPVAKPTRPLCAHVCCRNRSDELDLCEIQSLMMSLGVHLDQAEISQIQEELDYDHSGCVSFAEFAAGMLKDDDVRSRVHGGGSGAWWQFGGRGGGSTVAAAVRWQCAWRGDLTISRALRGGCTTLRRARVLRRGDHPGLAGLPTHGKRSCARRM
jgi:hypothetical protein